MTISPERVAYLREKVARGEQLDPAETLDWMDVQEQEPPTLQRSPEPPLTMPVDDDEDVEHHDVGLRRNALNILVIERGDMFGTAVPFGEDEEATLMQLQLIIRQIYASRRQQKP